MKAAVVTDDAVGDYMGAGGIRSFRFAAALRDAGVEVAIYAAGDTEPEREYGGFRVFNPESFGLHLTKFDAVVTGTLVRRALGGLKKYRGVIVHDLVCPFMLENLSAFTHLPTLKRRAWELELERDFLELASRANAYMTATDVQSAFWAGYFFKAGLWGAGYCDPPPVVVAPSGVERPEVFAPGELPADVGGIVSKLGERSGTRIIATSGGVYRWLDVEPLLGAVKILKERGLAITLFLPGLKHPSHGEQTSGESARALAAIESLGIGGDVVTCDWLPHRYRFEALRRASLGVNLHPEGLETEMSYRNRLLDFVSVEVPVVTSVGGVVSDRLIEYGIALPLVNLEPSNIADVVGRALDATWGKNFRFACAGFRQEFDAAKCAQKVVEAVSLGFRTPPPPGFSRGRMRGGGMLDDAFFMMRNIAKKLLGR